jgi:hypothetical protein
MSSVLTRPASALGSDERQHIGRPDFTGRLGHDREEHPQVIGSREHRVRPAPPAQELQVRIGQRHPEPDNQPTGAVTRTGHAQISSTHSTSFPSSPTAQPVKGGRNDKEDHVHNMQ